jgi:hypothetical protein
MRLFQNNGKLLDGAARLYRNGLIDDQILTVIQKQRAGA